MSSWLVGDVITEAKQNAFPYIREDQFNPGQSLSHCYHLDQEIQQMFGFTGPEQAAATQPAPVTIIASQNVNGYSLAANAIHYYDFKYIDNQGYVWPINMVPENHFDHPMLHPAGIVRGGATNSFFFPADPLEIRFSTIQAGLTRQFWAGNGDTFTYNYIVTRTSPFISLASAMNVPDLARPYVVAALTLQILLNSADIVPPPRLQMAQLRWQQTRQELQLLASKRFEASFRAGEQR